MSVLHENQRVLDERLATLELAVKDARRMNRRVRENIEFEPDLDQVQIDKRLAKINPFLGAIQSAVDGAKAAHGATDPIVEE